MINDLTVIMPAYNEEESIGEVINRIRAVNPNWEIIVVDDCSTDSTKEVAEKAGAKVVRHTYNLGNGAAVKTGALNAKHEILVFMDADGQHPPEKIPDLLTEYPAYDMAVGTRTEKSKTDLVRNLGNFLLRSAASRISGYDIPDLTCGFRMVKKRCFMQFFDMYPQRYSYPTTITLALLGAGYFVKFVPIDDISARKKGASGISSLKDGMRFINIIIRVIMLFHPARIFIPLALVIFGFGFLSALYQLLTRNQIGNFSLLVLQTSFLTFVFGLLAEQIALLRQSDKRKRD